MNKAEFRIILERTGMTQALLASIARVDIRTVKRWCSASNDAMPPDDITELVMAAADAQRDAIDDAVDSAREEERATVIRYWARREDYESSHPGRGEMYLMANANARLLAWELEREGLPYSVELAVAKPEFRAFSFDDI